MTKIINLLLSLCLLCSCHPVPQVHVWDKHELSFEAKDNYTNPYTDVEIWVELKGPGFDKKVYGFWDGENIFRVRVVATQAGTWTWTVHSNVEDKGLNGKSGSFTALDWTEDEIDLNENRRGFLRSSPNGHALNYADGTPFFYIADTWWAASTWRFPFKGEEPDPDYVPGPGMGLEEAIQFRKKQGFNGFAMIASFPNWQEKEKEAVLQTDDGIFLRKPWTVDGQTAIMPDEQGNAPFEFPGVVPGFENVVPDFNKINPAYFQSLDKKMEYVSEEGFVPFFEALRRDQAESWKHYYDWPGSYIRYVQYLAARYTCYNMIFSGIHLDAGRPVRPSEFNDLLTQHMELYGPLPFGQPTSTNIPRSTYRQYGHGNEVPWLTVHGVGNSPRDHRLVPLIQEIYFLDNPLPVLNNEPFYPHSFNRWAADIHGDQTSNNRACAWACVLNGALVGHIHGTQGYYISTGDPKQGKPYTWEGLAGDKFFDAGDDMKHLKEFMMSEGPIYQELVPARQSLAPNQISEGLEEWYLSGWSYLMRTKDRALIIAYFEVDAPIGYISGLNPGSKYSGKWFNPRDGSWIPASEQALVVDSKGTLQLPDFPGALKVCLEDWALKLKIKL